MVKCYFAQGSFHEGFVCLQGIIRREYGKSISVDKYEDPDSVYSCNQELGMLMMYWQLHSHAIVAAGVGDLKQKLVFDFGQDGSLKRPTPKFPDQLFGRTIDFDVKYEKLEAARLEKVIADEYVESRKVIEDHMYDVMLKNRMALDETRAMLLELELEQKGAAVKAKE